MRDHGALERAVRKTVSTRGRLDVVVANAGITSFGSVEGMEAAEFERVIDVNLVGAYRTVRAALPEVRARGGYVLLVASLAAAIHSPLQAHYTASKAGVEALGDALRQELADARVDVGVVYPTFASTEMMRETHADPLGAKLWGGNRGVFAMVSADAVVASMVDAIVRRAPRACVPSHLAPLVLAPGLFHPVIEALLRRGGARDAIRAARARSRATGCPPREP